MRYFKSCLLLIIGHFATAQGSGFHKDILYAHAPQRELRLDLYLPNAVKQPYLILWVHGGAWSSGSKENPPLDLLNKGYALASIDYRLTTDAIFPAFVYDIKAAIRYLRANASAYGYHADKMFIWGSSAGGHLAALAGVTNRIRELEGNLGDYLKVSSDLQGIIDFYGPSNLTTILAQSTPHGIQVRAPALALMFGKPIDQIKDELEKASPVYYVSADDPPLFICHGDQDIQVPINQSIELYGKYKALKLPVQMEYVYGAGHGGKQYNDPKLIDMIDAFLKKIILNK